MKIAIAGTSYVDLSNGIVLAQHNEVICLHIIPEEVAMLNHKESQTEDAEIEAPKRDVGFEPKTPLTHGVGRWIAWYRSYTQS